MIIQNTYNRNYTKGQVGQIAKTNESYNFEQATFNILATAVGLPGQAVYLEQGASATNQGDWVVATTAVQAQTLATHILGFELNDVANSTNTGFIEYEAGATLVKALAYGTMYVVAGASILRGQAVYFDTSDLTQTNYLPLTVAPTTEPAKSFIALENANAGDILGVRLSRIGLGV